MTRESGYTYTFGVYLSYLSQSSWNYLEVSFWGHYTNEFQHSLLEVLRGPTCKSSYITKLHSVHLLLIDFFFFFNKSAIAIGSKGRTSRYVYCKICFLEQSYSKPCTQFPFSSLNPGLTSLNCNLIFLPSWFPHALYSCLQPCVTLFLHRANLFSVEG